MEWEEFKNNHKDIVINKTLAMELLDGNKNRDFVFFINSNNLRKHLLLTSSATLLILATIITTIMWFMNYRIDSGYTPLSILLCTIILSVYTRNNAMKILINTCVTDENFYKKLKDFGEKINVEIFKLTTDKSTDYFEKNLNYELIISNYSNELIKIESNDYIPHTKNLPYPKNIIKKAILKSIENTKDNQKIEELKVAYILISQWQENATKESNALQYFNVENYNTEEEGINAYNKLLIDASPYNEKCQVEREILIAELKELNLWNYS